MEKLRNTGIQGLKKLGGYLETDMIYVAKSGFWLTLGQIFSSILALLLSIFFANYVSKDIYGEYKFVLSVTSILGAISLTGMGTVVIQEIAKGKEGVLKSAVETSLRWGIFTFIFGLLASLYYFINGNNLLGISMLVAGISMPLINSFGLYGGYFSGKRNFRMSTVYWLISQLIIDVGLVVVSIFSNSSLYLISIYFLLGVITSIWSYFHILTKYKLNQENDSSMIGYGKHISLMNFFGTLSNQLDKILVFHYLGAIDLAIYSFSQAIPEQIKGSYKNLFAIALPKYAVLPDKDLRKSIIKKTGQLTIISTLIVILYIIISPFIFKLLFPKYIESVIYSQIYILGLIAIPGISLFGIYFQIKKATKTMYKLSITSNFVTMVLTFVLIYNFGLKGAVIENGLSWLIMLLINYYFFATHKEESLLPQ